MQNNKQNPASDEDILQCQAELREAMKAMGRFTADNPAAEPSFPADAAVPMSEPVETDNRFLEATLSEADLSSDAPAALSFVPDAARPRPDVLNLERELREKTRILDEQTKRIFFIEKQLQNAVVLERAKSQLQQDVQRLSGENRQLAADNQRLSVEIAQVKARPQNSDGTDAAVQQLRRELENAERTASRHRTFANELRHTIESLEDNLAAAVLEKRQLSEKLTAFNGQLQQTQADAEQLRHEYEAFQTQAVGEIHSVTENNDLLKKEVAEIRREKEELLSRVQQLQSTESQLRRDICRLQESVQNGAAAGQELAAVQEKIQQLQHKNQTLQSQLDAMRQSIPAAAPAKTPALNETAAEAADYQSEAGGIPIFNLAEQIMEEHRRSTASRRQRREASPAPSSGNSVKTVVQQYVHSAVSPAVQTKHPGDGLHPWIDRSLTSFQQEILREIIHHDIALHVRKYPAAAGCAALKN